jgi:cbb3-type cytochrome oxidase maturation protein
MIVIFLLIPLSILIAVGFLGGFIWAVRSGQYEDTCTPSLRPLMDEPTAASEEKVKANKNCPKNDK